MSSSPGSSISEKSTYSIKLCGQLVGWLVLCWLQPVSWCLAQDVAVDELTAQVAGILSTRCVSCHGSKKQEGGYRLDTLAAAESAGDSGVAPLRFGKPNESELLNRLTTTDKALRMPAEADPLPQAQIDIIGKWLASTTVTAELRNRPLAMLARLPAAAETPKQYPSALPIVAIALAGSSADQTLIWTNGYGEILHWKLSPSGHQLIHRLPTSGTQIGQLRLSRTQQLLAVSSGSPGSAGQVELFHVTQDEVKRVWQHRFEDVPSDLAFSPDGLTLAIALGDGSLACLTTNQLDKPPRVLTPHADAILAVAWSASGDRIVTGSRDRTAKIFAAPQMELIANYDRHERAVGGVCYIDQQPLSLDETGKLRVWTGDDNDRTLAEHDNLPRFLQHLSSDNNRAWLAAGGQLQSFTIEHKKVDDGKDEQGNAKKKNVTRLVKAESLSTRQSPWLLSCDGDGQTMVAGSEHGRVTVWQLDKPDSPQSFLAKP